jgi:hypothetical protein
MSRLLRWDAGLIVVATLGLGLVAGCTTRTERCGTAGERYQYLFALRTLAAIDVLEARNEEGALRQLISRTTHARLGLESSAHVCERLDADELSRCVEVELEHFVKRRANDGDLGLDLEKPWLLSPEEPACAAILRDLEKQLELR